MLGNNLGLMQTAASSGATYTYATWDAATKGSDVTLTNGNLTASSNYTVAGAHCVVGTMGKTTGKWYWEVRFDALAAGSVYPMLGVARASFLSACSTTDYPGKTADSWGYYGGSGAQYNNASSSAFGAAYAVGDIVGFALDADARSCQVYKNGVLQGTWSSIPGTDALYPVGIESSTVTANFGASMLKFQPPAGYNAGLFTASGLPTFATWNPSDKNAGISPSNGNLSEFGPATASGKIRSTIGVSSGKWYWEFTTDTTAGPIAGIANASSSLSAYTGSDANSYAYYSNGNKYNNGSNAAYGATFGAGDIIGVALDMDAGTLSFYKNGVSQGVAYTGLTGTYYASAGNSGGSGSPGVTANFGATPLVYAPPAGYSHGLASASYTPAINYATFDPNDKSSYSTLSGGNLVSTFSNVGGKVRGTRVSTSGKWYCEHTVNVSGNLYIGVSSYAASLSSYTGSEATSVGYNSNSGNIYKGGTGVVAEPSYTTGDVIGTAYDAKTGDVSFYKNGGFLYTVSAVSAGMEVPSASGAITTQITANFGATALKYAPPAGYSWGVGDRPTPFSRSYATWNPADKGANVTLSNGNLTTTNTTTASIVRSTIGKSSGKWYWEVTVNSTYGHAGIANATESLNTYVGSDANGWAYNSLNGLLYTNGTTSGTNATWSTVGDVIGFALDLDAGTLKFYKNGTLQPSYFSGIPGGTYYAAIGTNSAGTNTANFGATPFAYPAPTGFTGLY